MTWNLLKSIFIKELKLLRASIIGVAGNYRFFLGIIVLLLLGTAGLIFTFYNLFSIHLYEVSAVEKERIVRFIVMIILMWLTFLIFFSAIQESKIKFFNTEFNFLMSTPISPWLLFVLRLLKSVVVSMSNSLLLLFFGLGPLIGLGISVSIPWSNYFFIIIILYLYLIIPVALGIIFVIFLVRIFTMRILVKAAAALNFILIIAWIFFITIGQEILLSNFVGYLSRLENYIDWIFPFVIVARIIGDLVLDSPIEPYMLSFLFFPMVIVTLLIATLVIKNTYQKSYEKSRTSHSRVVLPTVEMSLFRLLKRKFSPLRKFLIMVFTNYILVFRDYIAVLKGAVFLGLAFFYVMVLSVGEVKGGTITSFFSILLIAFLINSSIRAFFKSTEYYIYYKLASLNNWYLIWGLWITKYIWQFFIGMFFLILLLYIFELSMFLFINFFIFLVLLLCSIESFGFLLNIMKYQGFIKIMYFIYFVAMLLPVLFLQDLGVVYIMWILNLVNLVAFVVVMCLCERQWERMEC